jgi:hypothetical protein
VTGKPVSLSDYLQELTYAAETGAAKIASSVTATGKVAAATGVNLREPGVGLQAVLARNRQRSGRSVEQVDSDRVPKIADQMAANTLDQGARLLSGRDT